MKTKVIFLRHAHTQKDQNKNAKTWILSEEGKKQAQDFVLDPIVKSIDVIYSSDEEKSVLTATPVAEKLGKKITRIAGFDEVKRGDRFLSDEEFKKEKQLQLEDWNHQAQGGETGNEAIARFEKSLSEIVERHPGETILVISHGTVLNLYFAKITNSKDQIFYRWQQTKFCSYGIVEDGKVTKDITV